MLQPFAPVPMPGKVENGDDEGKYVSAVGSRGGGLND